MVGNWRPEEYAHLWCYATQLACQLPLIAIKMFGECFHRPAQWLPRQAMLILRPGLLVGDSTCTCFISPTEDLLNLGVAGLPRCVTLGRIVSLHHGSNPRESIKCYTTVILVTFECDCASNVKSLSCNCPRLQLTGFLRLLRATPRWPMRSTCWCIHPNFSSMHQPCSESNKLLSLQAEPRIHR